MKAKVQLFQKVERMHKNICLQIAGWVQLAIWLHGCCSFPYFYDDCSRKVFNNIKPGKDACQKKAENIEVIGKRMRTLKLGGGVLAIAHNLL